MTGAVFVERGAALRWHVLGRIALGGDMTSMRPEAPILAARGRAREHQEAYTAVCGTHAFMTPVPAIGAICISLLCGFGLGACGMDASPLSGAPKSGIAPMSLKVDTVPSGAQARTRDGAGCETPCDLTVAPMGPFMVEFTLKNYETLSVEIVLAPLNPADLSAGLRLDPNPLTVELTPIPRPSLPGKPKPVAKASAPKLMWPEVAGAVWPSAR